MDYIIGIDVAKENSDKSVSLEEQLECIGIKPKYKNGKYKSLSFILKVLSKRWNEEDR
jgi:hypothetical protein